MVRPPKTVLVATDFSETSDDALRMAGLVAQAYDASVVVLHVFDPTPAVPPVVWKPRGSEESIATEMEIAVREAMTGKTAQLLAGVPDLEITVRRDASAWRGIIAVAEEFDVDQIIVGSHGRGGLSRALLGSVAEQVVRHASCPVLVVRPQAGREKG